MNTEGCWSSDEDEAERDLTDDKRVAKPQTAGYSRRLVFQRRHDVAPRCLNGGREAAQHGCDERESRRKDQHAAIQRERDVQRHRKRRQEPYQKRRERAGEEKTGGSAQHEEDHRLREHLPYEPRTTRPDGDSDGNLAPARAGAGDQQAGQIGAGNDQHERHEPHHERGDR